MVKTKPFMTKTTAILLSLLTLGFGLRMIGVNYGLPLWLVGDEPPFIIATLQMLKLQTLFPVLHPEIFNPILYFPPYLSYLYLIPFALVLGLQYLFHIRDIAILVSYITADPSSLFILARIISALAGTATILFVYKAGKHFFQNTYASLIGAIVVTMSASHALLSHWGRDWTLSIFLFALALALITDRTRPAPRRACIIALISGVGFGVSVIAGFIPLFVLI
jgi:dolichyl-phosphate-mannose--protein O-mannosyl transferase